MIDLGNKEEIREMIQLAKDSGEYRVGTVERSQDTPISHWRKSQGFGKKSHSLGRKERHISNIQGMVDNGNGYGINNKIRTNTRLTVLEEMKAQSHGIGTKYSTKFNHIDNMMREMLQGMK